eukprot:318993_1
MSNKRKLNGMNQNNSESENEEFTLKPKSKKRKLNNECNNANELNNKSENESIESNELSASDNESIESNELSASDNDNESVGRDDIGITINDTPYILEMFENQWIEVLKSAVGNQLLPEIIITLSKFYSLPFTIPLSPNIKNYSYLNIMNVYKNIIQVV